MASFPTLTAPLGGEVAQLRHVAERDIPEILIAHQDDPRLHVALGARRPPSGAELGRAAEQDPVDRATGTGATLTIVLTTGGDDCRGQVLVREVDAVHARARIRVWVAPGVRRRGLATEALRLAGHWLLGDCGLRRLAVLCDPGNAAMLEAARAAGFRDEGVLRAYERARGGRVDRAVLSLVTADLESR